jgi:hypothetical protein
MALSTKKYFLNIIFLVSPIALMYAQSTLEKPTISIDSKCETATTKVFNQKNDIADKSIGKLDNSNQFIVGLSNPKDSSIISAETNNQSSNCDENSSLLTSSYSLLAKDIIENYKYDFSETFIDILFFERIDLARTRTI